MFYRPADNCKRVLSILIDITIILFLMLLYYSILMFTTGRTYNIILITYIPTFIVVCYYIFPVLLFGQTVGKKMFRLKIVSIKSGKITLYQLIKRLFFSFGFWPGILYIFFNEGHLAIHDKISQTKVIDVTSQPKD
ncbi:RDD family protein [Desulforamulus aeronauticus]|uniref:RDD family protein n=1 Tax=Desulforamulus aeronauticus TaxID=53343 RepID=UPI003B75B90D